MLVHVTHALRTSVSCRNLVTCVSTRMLLYTAVIRVAGVYVGLTPCYASQKWSDCDRFIGSSLYVLVHLHAMRYVARYPSSQASCADHVARRPLAPSRDAVTIIQYCMCCFDSGIVIARTQYHKVWWNTHAILFGQPHRLHHIFSSCEEYPPLPRCLEWCSVAARAPILLGNNHSLASASWV